jgi:hypothetical protein
MRASGHRGDDSWTSFGQRRGISDPARFGLDLTRTIAASGGAAGRGSYPSPPMSGSPPIPPKPSHEGAERSQGTYQATQDVYSRISTTRSGERTQAGVGSGGPRSFYSDTPERAPYTYPRPEGSGPGPLPFPQSLGQVAAQSSAYFPGPVPGPGPSHPGPLPAPQTYPVVSHHPIPDSLHDTTPKPQRKTKGHVASACVPCKKAHLRFVVPAGTGSSSSEHEALTVGRCDGMYPEQFSSPILSTNQKEEQPGSAGGTGAAAPWLRVVGLIDMILSSNSGWV